MVTQDVYGSGRGGELVRLTIEQFYSPGIIYAGGLLEKAGQRWATSEETNEP